ncbi:MAG: DUF1800 domain-containing protein, partial [Pseudomonadota bacterium]
SMGLSAVNVWRAVMLAGGLACLAVGTVVQAQGARFADGFEPVGQRSLTQFEAARILTQATYGPTPAEIAALQQSDLETWFNNQLSAPISLQRPFLENLAATQGVTNGDRRSRWGSIAIYGEDQLRQRIAWALSQILVISQQGMGNDIFGLAEYYDLLARNAFGNYRQLLEEVSLSPQMGRYLSHLRNRKANPNRGTLPDENYAREIMQLFSIGLVKLNLDHTPMLDNQGQPLPTYDQTVIGEMAKIFTGWTYANSETFFRAEVNYLPMVCFEEEHEPGEKVLLDGAVVPAGQSCEEDLTDALDIIFNHPNVGPFISRQLILKLVTSNPPPEYVARVAQVFNNNGSGVRGDLEAVVRAILFDPVARGMAQPAPYGRPREPLLKLIAMYRAFNAVPAPDGRSVNIPTGPYAQSPLFAPTVFNFYSPSYQAPGEIQQAGLVSPEFQIIDEGTIATAANHLFNQGWNGNTGQTNPPTNRPAVNVEDLITLLDDPAVLVDELDLRMLHGSMSSALRQALIATVEAYPSFGNDDRKVYGLIHLLLVSPEFAVQR